MSQYQIPLGERSIVSQGSGRIINIPAELKKYDFPEDGKLNAYYDAKTGALVYYPVEEGK